MGPRSSFLRAIGAVILATVLWVVLGFAATSPLGAIYGWSGHPAIPAAPVPVYVLVYLVALPAVSLGFGWKVMRWAADRA